MKHRSRRNAGSRRSLPAPGRPSLAGVQRLEPRHALSGTPSLVADINPGAGDGVAGDVALGNSSETAVIEGTVYFPANDGVHGTELWRRSGDAAPEIVADITAGPASSILSGFTVSAGKLFFTVATSGTGTGGNTTFALWVSDGTAAGTLQLVDQVKGSLAKPTVSSATRLIAPFAGGVIFAAADATHGAEPWFSDGTPGGTKLLADIADTGATAGPNGDSAPEWFTPLGGEVFFAAADGEGDRQIWKTDGTAAGTVRVTSLSAGAQPENLAAFGSRLVFAAADAGGDVEPWITDGTLTQRLADVNPTGSSYPGSFVAVGDLLYFAADDGAHGAELWVADGTADGTRLLIDINVGSEGSAPGEGSNGLVRFVNVGPRNPGVVFTANDGTGPSLWTSDGTREGTAPLPLFGGIGSGTPGTIVVAGGMLYFTADLGGPRVLFESDGTAVGGRIVELAAGQSGARAGALAATADRLLFTADDGVNGAELWQLPFVTPPPPDTVAPTVTIESSVAALQPGGQATITFTVSEAGTGFTNTAIQTSGGTLTAFTGDGTTFTATFTADTSATSASISVASGAFTDGAGNPSEPATLQILLTGGADTTPPTVSIESSASQLRAGETATITFTFSEPVDGFTAADVRVYLGSLTGLVAVSPSVYKATFTPDPGVSSEAAVFVDGGSFSDLAGNANLYGAGFQLRVNTVLPTVAITAVSTTIAAGASTTITFKVSESGTGFAESSVQMAGGALTDFSGDGTTFTAVFTADASATSASISVPAGAFTNGAGNPNESATLQILLTDGADTTPPTVSIESSVTQLAAGETATITFTLSEPVDGFTAADVLVTLGTLSGFAQQSLLVYTATFTPDAGVSGVASLTVSAGAFTDAAGNENAVGASVQIAVDTASPTVSSVTANPFPVLTGGTAIFTFGLSEPVASFDPSLVDVTGGTLSAFTNVGTTYTATFTAGQVQTYATLRFRPGAFLDLAGNPSEERLVPFPLVDATTPTVSIESSVSQVRAGQTATITFTLSEPVDGFTAADVLATLGTLSAFAQQSPLVYTATFTPDAGVSGVASLTVSAGAFTDAAGNANTVGASSWIVIDTAPPTVSIGIAPSVVPAYGTATVTFTLSEPVSGFTAAGVQVTGGTLSEFTGAGTIYTATIRPFDSYSPTTGLVSIAAGAFADLAGNPIVAADASYSSEGYGSIYYDFTPPAVAITADVAALRLGQTTTLTFTLSEPCVGFSSSALVATAGTISGFTGSGLVFTATYTPPVGFGGPVTLAVRPAAFTDVAGNANAASQFALDVNTIVPVVTISTTLQPGQILAVGRTVEIHFAVSEPTADFGADDVQVSGGVLSGFTGSGTAYSAILTPLADFTGSATVTVPAGRFTGLPRGQAAGNANAAAAVSPPLPVDARLPTIAIAASTSQLRVGQTATIAFTLSEPAAAFSPAMIRTIGGTLSGFSGAGSSYTAVFTPQPGFLGAGDVGVAAGAFTDVAGNANIQPATAAFVIDTQPPTAVGATAIPAGFHKAGAVLGFELLMSEPVTVVGTPRLPLVVGATPRQAVYVGSPDGSRLRFAYTVQPGDNTPVGDRTGPRVAGAIDLAGGSIRDPFGNDVVVALPAVPTADVVVDTTPPSVIVTGSQSLLGAGKTSVITFTLSEPSPDFGPGSISTAGCTLSGFTGSGTVYTATLTPQANLTGTAVVRVDMGRFADRAGNAAATAADRATAVDSALRFAAGTDGQSVVWDREFAYRAATATSIRLPLPASQAAFFTPRTVLSITPNGGSESIVATVKSSGYDAATGSVVVTLDKKVPVTKTAGFGTLVLGGIVPPGARLLAGVSGAVVHEYSAAELLKAGYSPAFVTRFQGGLRTAAADLDDNGFADLIVAPGGVPSLPDPLSPGRRLADAFGSSLRTVAIFDGSPVPAWAPVKLDVGPVLGVATQGGFQVATGDVVADAAGSATLELIVASGTRLAVYDVRIAAAGARPVIDPVPIRVVELGAGKTATGVAVGRLFADDPYDDVVVAATTASGRVAGTTSVSVLAGAALDVVRSFPVSSLVESGPSRRLTDIFAFGASLAVGDIDGNGRNDLVLGAGSGGLGNFRVLANEFITADAGGPAFAAAIRTQLGTGGIFAQSRVPTQAWRPTGGPDYFTPGPVIGPTGQGFNAPVSVRVVNVSTTGSARAEVFAALGATNQTANTVKRFLFTGPGGWTSAAAFNLLPSSAADPRFRRGAGVRLG